jgi:hypothetical protein
MKIRLTPKFTKSSFMLLLVISLFHGGAYAQRGLKYWYATGAQEKGSMQDTKYVVTNVTKIDCSQIQAISARTALYDLWNLEHPESGRAKDDYGMQSVQGWGYASLAEANNARDETIKNWEHDNFKLIYIKNYKIDCNK